MKKICRKRIEKLQKELSINGIDLALFTDRENLIYFTGLTQIECMAVLIPALGEATIVSLWLDIDYIKENSGIENVKGYKFPASNLGEKVVQVIKELDIINPKIGFGKYFVEFSVYEALRKGVSGAEFVNVSETVYKIRSIKDPEEVEHIKKACDTLIKGMDAAIGAVKEGVTEVDVLAEAEYAMCKAGSEGSSFRMQVLIGKRQLLTHPYAENNKITGNETVVIHLGSTYKGYCAKMCRTVALGKVPQETKAIYTVLLEAQQAAIKSLKPSISVKEVYQAAYNVIDKAGYAKYFIDDIGHGVGLRQSEFYPIIGRTRNHYIYSGMVVDLIFPTIYHKQYGGSRITDMIHVTSEGPKLMTDYRKDLIEIN